MTVLLDMAVSLDGCISAPGGSDGGLHDWYFDPTPPSKEVIDELVDGAGALLLGRGAFGHADDAEGWDDSPYRVPHIEPLRLTKTRVVDASNVTHLRYRVER